MPHDSNTPEKLKGDYSGHLARNRFEGSDDETNMYFIADDFTDFLAMLHE